MTDTAVAAGTGVLLITRRAAIALPAPVLERVADVPGRIAQLAQEFLPRVTAQEVTDEQVGEVVAAKFPEASLADRSSIAEHLRRELDLVRCPLVPGDQVQYLGTDPGQTLEVGSMVTVVEEYSSNLEYAATRDPGSPNETRLIRRSALTLAKAPEVVRSPAWTRDHSADRFIAWRDLVEQPMPTVDQQMTALKGVGAWPGDGCGDNAEGKEALGHAMRLKWFRWLFSRGYRPEPLPVVVEEPVPAPVLDEKEARIVQLLAELERTNTRLREAQTLHRKDIDLIAETLIAEAEDRDWCAEYDRIIDRLNTSLTVSLQERTRTHEVQITGHLRVPFSHTVEVEASAGTSRSDIEDAAKEQFADSGLSARNVYVEMSDAEFDDDIEAELQ